jgi:hypothetical protein
MKMLSSTQHGIPKFINPPLPDNNQKFSEPEYITSHSEMSNIAHCNNWIF